jgi:hypothetical protein
VKVGTYHLMVRNNIVVTDTSAAITVETTDKWGRQDGDIRILNNTAVTHISNGRFLNLPSAGGAAGAITLKNNLWLVPKFAAGWRGSAPVFVYGDNLNMFKEISNNVWPVPASYDNFSEGGMFYVWSYFSDKRGYKDAKEWDAYANVHDEHYANTAVSSDLTPKAGTFASTGGVATGGVFADFYGRTRSRTGRISAGAVQTL